MARKVLNIIAFTILLFGGLSWAIIGIFNYNLISGIFMGTRSVGGIIFTVLMGASALWLIISAIVSRGRIQFVQREHHHRRDH